MDLKGRKLGRIFVELGLLDEDQEKAALEYARVWGVHFGQACVKMGFMDEELVMRALAVQAGAPSVSLAGLEIPMDVVDLVPKKIAEEHRVVALSLVQPAKGRKGTLVVAATKPLPMGVMDDLGFSTGHKVSLVIASDKDVSDVLYRYYGIDLDRHIRSNQMVDLSPEDDIGVVRDPLELANEFLPSIDLPRR
ncbi:MAG TPA: hypothetical protein VMV18_09665 [bacterium]|nr:hypothetical protein [bacterium]